MKSFFRHLAIFFALLFNCTDHVSAQTAFLADYMRDSTTFIGYGVLETSDGGFLTCTSADTNSFTLNDWDACLVKTDSNGLIQWNTFIGGPSIQLAIDAVELPSGEFMFAANLDTGPSFDYTLMVGKVSSAGAVLWLKYYDNLNFSGVSDMIQTVDGNIMIGAGSGSNRALLAKIDTAGNVLWSKKYGNTSEQQNLYRVIQTSDSGYAFSGFHTDNNTGNLDLFLVKTNSYGDTLFTRTAEYNYFNEGFEIRETPEHDLIVAGSTQDISGTTSIDIMMVKYSATGNLLWSKVYYTTSQEICYGLSVTADSGYVVGGVGTNPFTTEFNTFFFKTNSAGDTLWTQMYDYPAGPYCTNITSSDHSIAAGQSQYGLHFVNVMPDGSLPCNMLSPGFTVLDTLIHSTNLITDVEPVTAIANPISLPVYTLPITENIVCTTTGINENSFAENLIFIKPNPANDKLSITSEINLNNIKLQVVNIYGEIVFKKKYANIQSEAELDVSKIKNGIYFLSLIKGEKIRVYKFIVQH